MPKLSQTSVFVGAALLALAHVPASAASGVFYDPSNVASPSGKTIGHELFSTIGCPGKQLTDAGCPVPKDDDKDGVVNEKDQCPNTPAGRKVDEKGCELDGDKDGVVDALDQCPDTPAGRKVDAKGCELDSDGDGVVDGLDQCPDTPAGRAVDAKGCELDSDGDGIVDAVDKCPTVFAKTADGCPPGKFSLDGVNFDNDQATVRAEDMSVLDAAAETLQKWGDVSVEVAGHTDSVGSDDYNLVLSQRRADAVRNYLIGKGVAANRLTAKGYGESQPIADNATDDGRFQNRRVELVPQQ